MMLKYILVATVLVTFASCCCFPKQFSSFIGSSNFNGYGSSSYHHASVARLFLDVCNNRLRYDSYNTKYSVIVDYKNEVTYQVTNGTKCQSFATRGNITRICVPPTYNYLTSGSIGAGKHRLGYNVFGYQRTSGNNTHGHSWVTSARGCIPVTQGSYAKFPKGGNVNGAVWVNFTVGVADLHVFDKPRVCKNTPRSLETMDFDIIDRIESDFSKEVKDSKKAFDSMMGAYGNTKPNIPTFQEKSKEEQNEEFDGKKFLRENFGVGAFDF